MPEEDEGPAPYLTEAEMRSIEGLSDASRFDAAVLTEALDEFTETAEGYRGQAFVPRTATWTTRVERATSTLVLPHPLLRSVSALTVDGDELDVEELDVYPEYLVLPWARSGRMVVTYSHGADAPPATLKAAAREFVRLTVLATRNPQSDMLSFTDPSTGMVFRRSVPNWEEGRPTGWETVDRRLNALPDRRLPGVA